MRISLLVFTLVVGISCTVSYKFNGGNINYDKVKTMKDIFLRQTRLKLVNNNADLEIDGEITGYNQYNQAVSADGYSSETKLTITVNVRFVNNTNHEQDFEQQFSAFRVYDSRELLTAVQDGLIAEMTKEITDQIFSATVANW